MGVPFYIIITWTPKECRIIAFYRFWAIIYLLLGVPYYNYGVIGPKTLLIIKAPGPLLYVFYGRIGPNTLLIL